MVRPFPLRDVSCHAHGLACPIYGLSYSRCDVSIMFMVQLVLVMVCLVFYVMSYFCGNNRPYKSLTRDVCSCQMSVSFIDFNDSHCSWLFLNSIQKCLFEISEADPNHYATAFFWKRRSDWPKDCWCRVSEFIPLSSRNIFTDFYSNESPIGPTWKCSDIEIHSTLSIM